MSASQMIVSADIPRPVAMLATMAVALKVSALGRKVVASECNPLRKMGRANELAVREGTVKNRPASVADSWPIGLRKM